MYYASTEDARSDLFLSGAVYVFGPIAVAILVSIVPITRIGVVASALTVLLPVAFTVLVPFLLIRYRDESLANFGLGAVDASLWQGVALALPIVAASAVQSVLAVGSLVMPVLMVGGTRADVLAGRLLGWVGLCLLTVYGTIKARHAFSGSSVGVRDGALRIGRILVIVVAVAGALLLVTLLVNGDLVTGLVLFGMPVAGVAGTAALVLRSLPPQATTTLPTLVTPVVLMAIGPFAISFDAFVFVSGVFMAALYAVIGLVIGVLLETRRSAMPVLGLALALGLLTGFGSVTLGR
jgi:hypothetical protein